MLGKKSPTSLISLWDFCIFDVMKKIGNILLGFIIVLFDYVLYVLDRLTSIFSVNTLTSYSTWRTVWEWKKIAMIRISLFFVIYCLYLLFR